MPNFAWVMLHRAVKVLVLCGRGLKRMMNTDGPRCAPEGGMALREGVCWSETAAIEQELKLRFYMDCSDCWTQLGRNCLLEEVG